jgi:hypothetical protein
MDQDVKDEEATFEFIERRKCNPNQFKMEKKNYTRGENKIS